MTDFWRRHEQDVIRVVILLIALFWFISLGRGQEQRHWNQRSDGFYAYEQDKNDQKTKDKEQDDHMHSIDETLARIDRDLYGDEQYAKGAVALILALQTFGLIRSFISKREAA